MNVYKNRESLVEVLLSGKYEEGILALRKIAYGHEDTDSDDPPVSYCPLGVACEMYRLLHPNKYKWVKSGKRFGFRTVGKKNSMLFTPPKEVCEFFGFTSSELNVITRYFDNGYAFLDIAIIIKDWSGVDEH